MENLTEDPRLGLPSASIMDIFTRCEGAYQLIKSLGLVKKENDAMRSGTVIHKALETHDYEGLNKSQVITADRIAEQEAKIVQEYGLETAYNEREVRYWYEDPIIGKMYSGQPDVVYFKEDGHVVSINYKTGWGELPPVEESMQIMSELVLVYVNNRNKRKITKMTGILLAPNAPNYKRQDLSCSVDEIEAISESLDKAIGAAITNSNPTYTKGQIQCKYCPAKPACPAHKESFQQTLAIIEPYYTEMLSEKAVEKIDFMNPLDRSIFYENIGVMQDILKACESRLKELADKKEVHGYILKESNGKRKITNEGKARDLALSMGLNHCLTVNFSLLEGLEEDNMVQALTNEGILERGKVKKMTKIKEPKPKKVKNETTT
jgi:hypothetical protein